MESWKIPVAITTEYASITRIGSLMAVQIIDMGRINALLPVESAVP